jgi:hypothetical protein
MKTSVSQKARKQQKKAIDREMKAQKKMLARGMKETYGCK